MAQASLVTGSIQLPPSSSFDIAESIRLAFPGITAEVAVTKNCWIQFHLLVTGSRAVVILEEWKASLPEGSSSSIQVSTFV